MGLEEGFSFSQGSLQDYVDCPRRFQLRYVRNLRWPAVQAEPVVENEQRMRKGAAFHRLVHQHLVGVPAEVLSPTVTDTELRRWWESYLSSGMIHAGHTCYPELTLSTLVGDARLMAQYDLIAMTEDGLGLIVDWKTTRKRPRRVWLRERLQTRVYPYVLVEAGQDIGEGRRIEPGQVRMMYWFANFPLDPEEFPYDTAQHQADGAYLLNLVEEAYECLKQCPEGTLLPRTMDDTRCQTCRYRSLCRRGVRAGWLDDHDDEMGLQRAFDLSHEFEHISEMEMG